MSDPKDDDREYHAACWKKQNSFPTSRHVLLKLYEIRAKLKDEMKAEESLLETLEADADEACVEVGEGVTHSDG